MPVHLNKPVNYCLTTDAILHALVQRFKICLHALVLKLTAHQQCRQRTYVAKLLQIYGNGWPDSS